MQIVESDVSTSLRDYIQKKSYHPNSNYSCLSLRILDYDDEYNVNEDSCRLSLKILIIFKTMTIYYHISTLMNIFKI